MASPAKIMEALPTTLPEDFGEWDDEKSPSTQPVQLIQSEHASRPVAIPLLAVTAEPIHALKKRRIVVVASSILLVVIASAMVLTWKHRTASSVKPVATVKPAANLIQQPEDPPLRLLLSIAAVSAPKQPVDVARKLQHSSVAASASDQGNANLAQAHAQMMSEQLNTPTRIRMARALPETTPPLSVDFAAASMDGSGKDRAIGSIFSDIKQPKVRVVSSKVVTISSDAAFGLLVQKRPPLYPPLAKTAGISGTVVLTATISRTGTVENLRVISGPAMLRGSAVDAVRSWRYKPYMLNNLPTEIETTINVSYKLDN